MNINNTQMNSTTINTIISKNNKLSKDQCIILKDVFMIILDHSIICKKSRKLYRDIFMVTDQDKIKLNKLGKYNGRIYSFYYGDKLCIMFEYFIGDIANIKKLVNEFNDDKNFNVNNRLIFTRLHSDVYMDKCDDIYFIIDMEKIII